MPATVPDWQAAPAEEPAQPEVVAEPVARQAEAVVEVAPAAQKRQKSKKPRANVVTAIVSTARQIQARREQARQAERAQIMHAIRRMNDEAYETMLLDFFRRDGYIVYLVDDPKNSAADFELQRNTERQLVGIKHRGRQVGQDAVRELDKEVAASGATGAFLFTDGHFTEAAIRVANNSAVTLIDGTVLAELIEELTMSELRERRAGARLVKALGFKKAS
jgi:HJR/Mrr/RecB family endonuclease